MLNSIKQSGLIIKIIFFLGLIIFSQLLVSCGKRKPPLPPVERISQKVTISGFQRGGKVFINWTMPARNADDSSVQNINRADVYRLAQPVTTPLNLTEEDFTKLSTIIASVPIAEEDFGLKQITYTDDLEFAGQAARLIYAIRFVNKSGQKAAFSNFLLVEPAARIAEAPTELTADSTENALILKWNPPDKNVDDSTPANILGFNIYRSKSGNKTFEKLNGTPINDLDYSDESFDFGQTYEYFVRTVSLGTAGDTVESVDSGKVTVSPVDIFAPTAPSAITIAAAPNNLAVFFATNPEKDIVGYRIYKTTNPDQPKSEWTLLTAQILDRNTFQDTDVVSGTTYYYYITAIDNAGNISDPSVVVSETAP